jgi:hypothetical protein
MIATWTLFRLQIRIMRWPILMVGAGLLIVFLPGRNEVHSLLDAIGGLANILVIALAGPILFGVEYQEGARDYLATRPIPPRTVLTVKVLLMVVLSLLGAWVIDGTVSLRQALGLSYVFEWVTPVVWAILLNISVMASAMTILCKDLVRGLLYGASPVMMIAVIGWFFLNDYKGQDYYWDGHYYHPDSLRDPLLFCTVIIAFVLSPLLSLAALISAFESSRFGKWTIPLAAWLLIIPYVGFIAFSGYALHTDGTGQSEMFPDSLAGRVFSRDPDNTHLWFCPQNPENTLLKYDPLNFQAGPARTIQYEDRWKRKDSDRNAFEKIIGDHLLVTRTGKIRAATPSEDTEYSVADIYSITDPSQPRLVKSIEIPGYPYDLINHGGDKAEYLFFPVNNGKLYQCTLDLSSLDLKCVTNTSIDYYRRYIYVRDGLRFRYVDEEIYLEDAAKPLGEGAIDTIFLPEWPVTVISNDLIAAYSVKHNWIKIYSKGQDSHYAERQTLFTFRSAICIPFLVNMGKRVGIDISEGYGGNLTLGDGYLGLWLGNYGRTLFWDIHNPDKPEYLGTVATKAAYPLEDEQETLFPRCGERNYHSLTGPTTPYRREDGAVGFIFRDRILWLEFPALMQQS